MGNTIYYREYIDFREFSVKIEVKDVARMRLVALNADADFRVAVPWDYISEEKLPMDIIMAMLEKNYEWMQQTYIPLSERLPDEATYHRFRENVCRRFPYWEEQMGLKARRIFIKDMRSRWGSCNVAKREISLSARLAMRPPECLDYVIVHELAHLLHADHSPAFWDVVARYIPDHNRLRHLLK